MFRNTVGVRKKARRFKELTLQGAVVSGVRRDFISNCWMQMHSRAMFYPSLSLFAWLRRSERPALKATVIVD